MNLLMPRIMRVVFPTKRNLIQDCLFERLKAILLFFPSRELNINNLSSFIVKFSFVTFNNKQNHILTTINCLSETVDIKKYFKLLESQIIRLDEMTKKTRMIG